MSSSGVTQRKNASSDNSTSGSVAIPSPSVQSMGDSIADASPTTKYLILYNLLSFILWYCVVVMLIVTLFLTGGSQKSDVLVSGPKGNRLTGPARNNVFPATYEIVRWTQSVAVLEIVHVALGFVRAGLLTTTLQVASRLFMVWGVLTPFGKELLIDDGTVTKLSSMPLVASLLDIVGLGTTATNMGPIERNQTAYTGMLIAWAITECIRYMFFIYFLGGEKAMDRVPSWLRWLRYNSFFVLYPLGIAGECWLVYNAIPIARRMDPRIGWAFMAILGIYVPGAYILYTHMLKQRARILNLHQKVHNKEKVRSE